MRASQLRGSQLRGSQLTTSQPPDPTERWLKRKPSRPPYSNQLWFPIVGVTVPSPVTLATMPECAAKDCTNPPLMLPSTLLPNRCVHCPPTLTRLVLSVPDAIEASNGLNATIGSE